ncbi:neuronal acetylcholine receptor subunit beta-3 isoform X2 [Nematostella vectensis]|nr:neuronal acetylcholine receptor subunit beta-3 isoform X2 [Nematostella vectensis]
MITRVWVTQVWRDPKLRWDVEKGGGIETIFVDPSEIWTPDISLYNNADDSVSVAGSVKKFQTKIVVANTGKVVWQSPATFRSECSIKIRYWPFDVQKCSMTFGSFIFPASALNVTSLYDSSFYTDRFMQSGDWDIKEVSLGRADTRPGKTTVSTLRLQITVERKPIYYIIYLISPCSLLLFLALMSFTIPSESGERIGFITTILLALTVYLLLVQQLLPETSDELPLVGLFCVIAIAETAFVLLLTILVLRCFYKEGQPPVWAQRLLGCWCCKKQEKKRKPGTLSKLGETYMNGYEMGSSSEKIATDIVSVFSQFKTEEEAAGPSWQDISRTLNIICFAISVVLISTTCAVIFTNSDSVTTDVS